MEQLVTTAQEVLLTIFTFLPNEDLNNAALVNSHCEFIARCAFIQTRISEHYHKNPHCGGSKLPTAQSYFAYFVKRVMSSIKRQVNTMKMKSSSTGSDSKTVVSGFGLPPLQYLIQLGLECELLFDSLCSIPDLKNYSITADNSTMFICTTYHDRAKTPLETLAALPSLSESQKRLYSVLVDKHMCRVTGSALGTACKSRNFDFIELLLKYHPSAGAVVKEPSITVGAPILHFLALLLEKPIPLEDPNREELIGNIINVIELLVESGFKLNDTTNYSYLFPFDAAFSLNSPQLIRKVLELGLPVSVNLMTKISRFYGPEFFEYAMKLYAKRDAASSPFNVFHTSVMWGYLTESCIAGNLALIEYFIKIHSLTGDTWIVPSSTWMKRILDMPIAYAVEAKQYDAVRLLLDLDISQLNAQRVKGISRTAMMKACESGDLKMVNLLLEYNDNLLQTNVFSSSAGMACSSLNLELVEMMVKKYPDCLNYIDSSGRGVYHYVLQRKHEGSDYEKLKQMLLYLFTKVDQRYLFETLESRTAAPTRASEAARLLPKGIEVLVHTYADAIKSNLLPIFFGDLEYVTQNIEKCLSSYERCISIALERGHLDLVKLLAQHHEQKSVDITKAIRSGSIEMLKYALSLPDCHYLFAEAVNAICEHSPYTPSTSMPFLDLLFEHYLTSGKYNATIMKNYNLKIDCDLEISNYVSECCEYFSNIVHLVIYRQNIDRVKELIESEKWNIIDRQNRKPIHAALRTGNLELIQMLGELVDDPANNIFCIHFAAQSGSLHVLKYVLENHGTDSLMEKDPLGQSVLHILLQHSTSFEELEQSLHYLCENYNVAPLLSQQDSNGMTPVVLAKLMFSVDSPIVDYLIVEQLAN
jgi:ankyrin repeat protein